MPSHRNSIPRQSISAAVLSIACAIAVPVATERLAGGQNGNPPGGQLRTDKVALPTAINQPPDANEQILLRERQASSGAANFAAANAARKKQICEDTAKLLKLSADLKAEVDKTSSDTLSLSLTRKAAEIETLAHGVKEKMKLTVEAE